MSQVQHSQTGEWHRTECPALTRQERVECECAEFDFYDVNPYIEAGTGEGFLFRWRGTEYVVECWAARNSGGEDIYEVDSGRAVSAPWNDEDDNDGIDQRFEEALEAFKAAWYEAWAKHVDPAIELAKREALGNKEAA